jgi:hypothetical protein
MAVALEKNQEAGDPKPIYGALTNATEWLFFKMTTDRKWIRSDRLYLSTSLLHIIRILVCLVSNGITSNNE